MGFLKQTDIGNQGLTLMQLSSTRATVYLAYGIPCIMSTGLLKHKHNWYGVLGSIKSAPCLVRTCKNNTSYFYRYSVATVFFYFVVNLF